MLECKFRQRRTLHSVSRELIDTCWNVNAVMTDTFLVDLVRINRYMLECK